MKNVRSPKWAGLSGGMLKLNPAASMVNAIGGRVSNSSERRPSMSMAHTAGSAPAKLTKPNMQEASKALNVEKPASKKI
jgi:hypothetical protein